jgi:hypothetical protein
MTFKDAQFLYDNMCEPDYPDEVEQDDDYEPDLEEPQEDLNAECRWW